MAIDIKSPGLVTPRAQLRDPTTLVALLCAGQIAAWTLAPLIVDTAPPLDVVESTMWGREWVVATYKHPAMPSWVLESLWLVTGAVGWPAYLASQLFIAATFLFVFLLGRELMTPARAAAGTLLLTGVAYYAWPTVEFNHNVAEAPFWAALPFALWRAVERRSIIWWVLVGAIGAAGLYAKLSTGLLLVTAAAWIVADVQARRALKTAGPYFGLAAFAVVAAPLAHWLIVHDFLPFKYAAGRLAQASGTGIPAFLASLALNLSGMIAMLAVAALLGRRSANTAQPDTDAAAGTRERQFLTLFTFGPLLLTLLGAASTHSALKIAWGSSMFNLAGLWLVAVIFQRFRPVVLKHIAAAAAALLVVAPTGYALAVTLAPNLNAPMRVNWPQAEISHRMSAIWHAKTNRPLRIVAGDAWIAGLVGISDRDRPSILNPGELSLTPWIDKERIDTEGMLIVWDARTGRTPSVLRAVVEFGAKGEEKFAWPHNKSLPEIIVGYSVLLPKGLED